LLTQEAIDLLVLNRINDSKIWYEEHKQEIRRTVIEPFFELIESLAPTMLTIDPEIVVEPRVDRTLSRIYRDTRFTKDKSRYRDSIWLYFNREKKLYPGYPSFFFELKPYLAWWGCGTYRKDDALTEACRKMILDRDPLFMELKAAYESQSYFRLDEDELFRRTRFPNEPEDIRTWLDRHAIYLIHIEEDVTNVLTDGLADRLRGDFLTLVPLYRFLSAAYDRAYRVIQGH
jgi:uncharacterized protein (TIGR02453 family)